MELDYKALGFKCGIEIHQQLGTKKKLFCRCPVGLTDDKPDARILRHMRPTLSELGEYDGTALMEFKTKKNVVYELFRDRTCSYEMDDTPPFPINQEALDIAIEISLLLNCSIVDEIHITRKQYLDGSIPTGFQRTAVIGVDGWIPYKKGKIRITQVNLEEDACREISDNGHMVVFRTDRLSTPLVEIITEADMKTPTEAMEVVEELGRVTKVTGKIRRGMGSVRQDVNVSIEGGTRVEIKGVSRYEYIEALTKNEAYRQKALLEIRDLLRTRGVTEKNIHSEKAFIENIFAETQCEILKNALAKGHRIGAIKLCGFASILKEEVQPGIPFAQEFSGRVRVIACLDSKPNILHHGNLYEHGVSTSEWESIKQTLNVKHTDAIILTWGSEEDVNTAFNEIKIRAVEATRGIPNDTRQAMPGGFTDFERVLPGADRMYPDTDSVPVEITKSRLDRIRKQLPETPWVREKKYLKLGLSKHLARRLSIYPNQKLVDNLIKSTKSSPSFIAATLLDTVKNLKRSGVQVWEISDDSYMKTFKWLDAGQFQKELMPEVLEKFASFTYPTPKDLLNDLELTKRVPPYKAIIAEALKKYSGACNGNAEKKTRFIMGRIMEKYRGVVEAEKIVKMLQKEV
jgi:glutamyl-tRNA(Gln) amidotransferase subunit E